MLAWCAWSSGRTLDFIPLPMGPRVRNPVYSSLGPFHPSYHCPASGPSLIIPCLLEAMLNKPIHSLNIYIQSVRRSSKFLSRKFSRQWNFFSVAFVKSFDFFSPSIADDTWLGLNDKATEGTLVWEKDVSFVPWTTWGTMASPNTDRKHCATIRTWNDLNWDMTHCSYYLNIACENGTGNSHTE